MLGDLRYGLRLLKREPSFAATAVVTLSLGIGAATFLFGIADRVLLRPLPWPEADRLVRAIETRAGRGARIPNTISNGTYVAWSEAPDVVDGVGAWRENRVTVTGAGEAIRVDASAVTPSLFGILRARVARGRLFESGEASSGQSSTAIISHGLWRGRFGATDDVIGRVIQLDGRAHTIVGVMAQDFAFPTRATRLWTPYGVPNVIGNKGVRTGVIMPVLARLKPGASIEQATAEATARAQAAPDAGGMAMALFGAINPVAVTVSPVRDVVTAEVRPALLVLVASVALMLIVAIANIAGLQLARATTRTREMAVRAAIGADRGRLARHLLVESLTVGIAGCVGGLLLAAALNAIAPATMLTSIPGLDEIGLDLRIIAFAVMVSLAASVASGLWPLLDLRRANLVASLADNSTAGGAPHRTTRRRAAIMVGQVAVASLLLMGAVVLSRSLLDLTRADRGYDPRNLITAQLPFPLGYPQDRQLAVRENVVARLRALPGVTSASYGFALPFVSPGGFTSFKLPSPGGTEQQVEAMRRVVAPGYLETMRLRVVAGRAIEERDVATSQPSVVVNTSFVARFLDGMPPQNALGRSLGFAGIGLKTDAVIVGVVDDMRQESAAAPRQPEMFISVHQFPTSMVGFSTFFVARSDGAPDQLAAPLRAALREQDDSLAFDSMMTMDERINASLSTQRAYMLFLAAFAVSSLLVVAVGLFGVLSYLVATRGRELAVRVALGATPRQVMAIVVNHAAVMVAGGIVIGLGVALTGATALSRFVYGAAEADVLSLAAAPAGLAMVAALACLLPARRAAAVDPVRVLRAE